MTDYFYARVSDKSEEGTSLETQIKLGLSQGVLRENIFVDEDRSAGIKDDDFEIINTPERYGMTIDKKKRPSFSKLLDLLKTGDTLKFTVWSRISRSLSVQEVFVMDCHKRKVKLVPLQDTEHPVARQVMGAVNQQYLEGISKEVTRVQAQQYLEGIHPGRAPTGYWKNSKTKNGSLLDPSKKPGLYQDPKQAEKVKQAFDMTNAGSDYKEVCKALGISPGAYYNIIKNPVYAGIINHRGQTKKGSHEPIITTEEFEQAQKKINKLPITSQTYRLNNLH